MALPSWTFIKLGCRGFFCYVFLSVLLTLEKFISTYVLRPFLNRMKGAKSPNLPEISSPILLKSATKLAAEIRSGKIKSVEVVKAFIDRIEQVNPILNAVVEMKKKEALDEAEKVDLLISSHPNLIQLAEEKPLLGIPITIKEHISVKGFHCTVGSLSRKDNIATEDSCVAHKLKEMGAIIIATTNVPEYIANFHTYNLVYGETINSYDIHRSGGGSSGGEGSIISAAGSVIGIGSDVAGSIRIPAYFNGIFGHFPTSDTVNIRGITPVAVEKLTAFVSIGPICRFAEDMRLVLKGIVEPPFKEKLDLKPDISSLKIYYIEEMRGSFLYTYRTSVEVKTTLHKAIKHLEGQFRIKVEKLEFPCLQSVTWLMFAGIYRELRKQDLSFFQILKGDQKNVNFIIEFARHLIGRQRHTKFVLLMTFLENYFLQPATKIMLKELQELNILKRDLKRKLGNDGVLLLPTHSLPPPYKEEIAFIVASFVYTGLMNVLGLPATHCPLGLDGKGLPTGIQVASNSNNDHLCLTVAEELERAFGGWVNPSSKTIF